MSFFEYILAPREFVSSIFRSFPYALHSPLPLSFVCMRNSKYQIQLFPAIVVNHQASYTKNHE